MFLENLNYSFCHCVIMGLCGSRERKFLALSRTNVWRIYTSGTFCERKDHVTIIHHGATLWHSHVIHFCLHAIIFPISRLARSPLFPDEPKVRKKLIWRAPIFRLGLQQNPTAHQSSNFMKFFTPPFAVDVIRERGIFISSSRFICGTADKTIMGNNSRPSLSTSRALGQFACVCTAIRCRDKTRLRK